MTMLLQPVQGVCIFLLLGCIHGDTNICKLESYTIFTFSHLVICNIIAVVVLDQGDAAAAEGVRLALEHAETLELGGNISSSLVRVTPTTSPAALVEQGAHIMY